MFGSLIFIKATIEDLDATGKSLKSDYRSKKTCMVSWLKQMCQFCALRSGCVGPGSLF